MFNFIFVVNFYSIFLRSKFLPRRINIVLNIIQSQSLNTIYGGIVHKSQLVFNRSTGITKLTHGSSWPYTNILKVCEGLFKTVFTYWFHRYQ